MARFILLLVLAMVIARTLWRFFDAILRGVRGPAQPGGRHGGAQTMSVKMQQCPVCGTYVVPGKAITLVTGGAPVYFDTEKCRNEYQAR
ncbi:MAG TPA: hypothetical protein VEA16_04285 [Vicinamibacterales bacterium]|nr:hypothetical protein [Vicinamibacterales bacterium]